MSQRRNMPFVVCLLSVFLAGVSRSQAQTIQRVNLTNNHIAYDAKSNRFYVSVPGSSASLPNTITPLDPTTGQFGTSLVTDGEPNVLALSDDGQFLYVGQDAAHSVLRITLSGQAPALTFSLSTDPALGAYNAEDLAVMPGNAHAVAVSASSGNQGVVLYDDGVPRPHSVPRYQAICNVLAFASASTLYAQDNTDTGFGFSRLTVDASGVTLADNIGNLLPSFFETMRYSAFDGLIYSSWGQTADPQKGLLRSLFLIPPDASGSRSRIYDVRPDPVHGNIYLLIGDLGTSDAFVAVYDSHTYLPKGSLRLAHAIPTNYHGSPVSDLTLWGSDGLAFRTQDAVFLISGRQLPGLSSLKLNTTSVRGGFSVTGTLTLTQPAPVNGVSALLSVGNRAFPVTIPAGKSQTTFTFRPTNYGSLAVTARYGAQWLKQSLSVLDPTLHPIYPPNVRVIDLDSNGLVYDKHRDCLFASVPSTGGKFGNSVVQILPANGAIANSTWMGSEPARLAISDDGKFLYAGLDGAAAIQPLALTTHQLAPTFDVGRDSFSGPNFVRQIVALPGQPQSIAVSRYHPYVSPYFAGVVVYDEGMPRPDAYTGFTGGEMLAAGADATRLYGYDSETTETELVRMALDASGITTLSTIEGAFPSFGLDFKYDHGKLFDSSGAALDAETGNLIALYPGKGLVVPDLAHNRVYYMNVPNGGQANVTAFAADTSQMLPTLPTILTRSGASDFQLWGVNRLAFRTSSQIFLVDLNPATLKTFLPSRPTVKGGTTAYGVIALSNYAPAGGASVALTSSNPKALSVSPAIVLPEGSYQINFSCVSHPVTANTVVTLTASYGGITKSATITVTP